MSEFSNFVIASEVIFGKFPILLLDIDGVGNSMFESTVPHLARLNHRFRQKFIFAFQYFVLSDIHAASIIEEPNSMCSLNFF
jgi:hypothetical protein